MNAHALLTSQGWRGTGHSLHPTSDSTGLSRPLLVSSKNNNLGIGKKQHKTSDMWWMNAFDKSLKGLDTSVEGQVKQTITSGGLDMVAKGGARFVGNQGGLYASFVKGEVLGGTLPETVTMGKLDIKAVELQSTANSERPNKKRKLENVERESKEERRARKSAKRAGRARVSESSSKEQHEEENLSNIETKEERRLRRSIKRAKKAQKGVIKDKISDGLATDESKDARRARKAAKRTKKAKKALTIAREEMDEGYLSKSETKEERRERRERRKLLKQVEQSTHEIIPENSRNKRRVE